MSVVPDYTLIDAKARIGADAGGLFVHYSQDIDSDYLDSLKSERLAKAHMRSTELDRVASVPTFLWDLWIRQGRDPQNATPRQIVSWLERDNLQAFICTPKSV